MPLLQINEPVDKLEGCNHNNRPEQRDGETAQYNGAGKIRALRRIIIWHIIVWRDAMEFKIESEKENRFFKRKDLMVRIAHSGESTPSKLDVKKYLAEKYKVDESQVEINYIFTMHGLNESTAKVRILNEKPKEQPATKEEPQGEPQQMEQEKKPEAK